MASNPICLIVCGATGRMGTLICQLAEQSKDFNIVGKVNRQQSLESCIEKGDLLIDFSGPEASRKNIRLAAEHKKPLVLGTTDLGVEEQSVLKKASQEIAIVHSANMSVGVNLLFELIGIATERLGPDFKIEISETHHVHKKDKPSGTAKSMGYIVEKLCGKTPLIKSKREGEVIGDHTIVFSTKSEEITLSHRALDRKIFVAGSLRAAKWILGKRAGLYTMIDVLKN